MRTGRRLLLAATVAAALVAAPAGAVAQDGGTVSIRLLDAPTDRADDPRAQIYVIDHLQPGDVIERRLEVGNTTPEAVTVALYAAAATIDAGAWSPLDGRAENRLTEWTTITPPEVVVAPGGAEVATLRVEVPDDASGGEEYAVAWAQLPSATDQGVTVVNRVGVRMYVSVGGPSEPETDFAITEVAARTRPDGTRSLTVGVDNIGGRAVDVNADVLLTEGPGGISGGPYEAADRTTIAPGGAGRIVIPIPREIPAGPWTADVVLRSGTTERTAELTVTWPEPGEAAADVSIADQEADDGGSASVAAGILAAVAILAVIAALAALIRSRRRA